jgi:hypothetical protein
MGAVRQDPPRFPLQDFDEVERAQILVVFSAFGIGERALGALVGQFVDACLDVGSRPVVD